MNVPFCSQGELSCCILGLRVTPPLSPDAHFKVGFPKRSNLNPIKNGKDSSYWEAKLDCERYEKKLPGHEVFFDMPSVCRKEEVMGCHPVSFQRSTNEIQYIFQSFVLNFQTFLMFQRRVKCSLQKKETWMSAQIICCVTVFLWQWVNGLISYLWISPTLKVTTQTASGWGK